MALDDETQAANLSDVFAALAHPRRLVMLECLLEEERAVGKLSACSRLQPTSQANTSQHLAILRRAGLVKEQRQGNQVIYRVASPKVAELLRTAQRLAHERAKSLL